MRGLTWIFCPGYAGMRGNELADRLPRHSEIEDDGQERHYEGCFGQAAGE